MQVPVVFIGFDYLRNSESPLMKLTGSILKLVRWPNLFFILLTQVLFYYCFVNPSNSNRFQDYQNLLSPGLFLMLIIASITIAAGGYIINDYFDLNIDKINKPTEQVIGKHVSRRWAIALHLLFSTAGILLSFYISYKIGNLLIGVLNLLTVVLLWFYSTTFKKQLLVGNLIISLLTAWVILVIYLCELRFYLLFVTNEQQHHEYIRQLFKVTILYSSFAFIISLVREVVKDIEDMEGDKKYGCKTMPIAWGIPASKVFVATWLIVLIAALIIFQFYALQLHWWGSAIYCIIFIILPLVYIFRNLYRAAVSAHYKNLSLWLKLTMLSGILSMIIFKFYHN
jgi:4-hydroxybenzoate polyprenyltransferase